MTRLGFAGRLAEADRCLFGTWVKIPSMETVEILADAGFDYIVVDQEHSPLTMEAAYRAMVAAQGNGMSVIVRVPDRSGGYLQRLLDMGVDGVLVPRVISLDQARDAVRQMTFSPRGDRGAGYTARAGRWGAVSFADYIAWGDTQVMRAVQLEDRETVAAADEILSIDGLNGVFLGMGDLTLSTGLPASDPEIQGLVDTFLEAANAHGVPAGTAVQTSSEALAAAERGYRFVMVSNDTSLMRTAASSLVKEIHEGALDAVHS